MIMLMSTVFFLDSASLSENNLYPIADIPITIKRSPSRMKVHIDIAPLVSCFRVEYLRFVM